jgi:hypothetical protein
MGREARELDGILGVSILRQNEVPNPKVMCPYEELGDGLHNATDSLTVQRAGGAEPARHIHGHHSYAVRPASL